MAVPQAQLEGIGLLSPLPGLSQLTPQAADAGASQLSKSYQFWRANPLCQATGDLESSFALLEPPMNHIQMGGNHRLPAICQRARLRYLAQQLQISRRVIIGAA